MRPFPGSGNDHRVAGSRRFAGTTGVASGPGRQTGLGFTLIELMVVILIIAILASIAYPTLLFTRRKMRVASTQQLVNVLSARITSHVVQSVRLPNGEERRLWDFNGDGILDGEPQRDPGFTSQQRTEAAQANYHGPLADLGIGLPPAQVDPVHGRARDAWQAALHIGFAAGRYGPFGIGVWSDGPDRRNGTDDDITSWSTGK